MNKPLIIIVFVVSIFVIGYIQVYNYINSVELTVEPSDIASYSVKESGNNIGKFNHGNKETVRVSKYSTVTVTYIGTKDYDNNHQDVEIQDSAKSVAIRPYYSTDYLSTLAESEKQAIIDTIVAYDPDMIKNYTVTDVTLYHYGEWASAKIIWNGKYGQNTDTLRLVLEKRDEKWNIKGQPTLLFFYKNVPNIPVDILRIVNNT